jgi:hypothetical protein
VYANGIIDVLSDRARRKIKYQKSKCKMADRKRGFNA